MPHFCDVAVPVPLDATFTYSHSRRDARAVRRRARHRALPREAAVRHRHRTARSRAQVRRPSRCSQVLDTAPALTPELMQLGRWIAQYYIAPIGEVLRTMLPLSAEFRRVIGYHITDKGIGGAARCVDRRLVAALAERARAPDAGVRRAQPSGRWRSGARGGAALGHRSIRDRCCKRLLRKKWIAREDLSDVRDASRTIQIATLKDVEGKLNANQQTIVDYLRLQPRDNARRSTPFASWLCRAPRCRRW